jgi:hypothetical protein
MFYYVYAIVASCNRVIPQVIFVGNNRKDIELKLCKKLKLKIKDLEIYKCKCKIDNESDEDKKDDDNDYKNDIPCFLENLEKEHIITYRLTNDQFVTLFDNNPYLISCKLCPGYVSIFKDESKTIDIMSKISLVADYFLSDLIENSK